MPNALPTTPVPAAEILARVHPWEERGLGKAPFRWLGVTRRVGPIRIANADGTETLIGAEGQPMGCCSYCGNGIAECHEIKSADGKKFIVGCDCVRRVEHPGSPVYSKAVRAAKDLANEKVRARSAVKAATSAARVVDLLATLEPRLRAEPSAYAWKAEKGETRYDDFEWLANQCGHAGRVRLIKKLEELASS